MDRRSLAFIAIGGVLLRLLAVRLTPSWSLTTDGERFRQLAQTAMRGTAFIPPLYPAFLATVWKVAGAGIPQARIAQSLLGGLTIVLTGVLAARLSRLPADARRASVLGAALAAFAPPLLFADLTVMAESVAAMLAAAYLVLASRPEAPLGLLRSGLAGAFLGLSSLCRSPMLFYTLVRAAAAWPWQVESGAVARTRKALLLSTAAGLLVVAPWTVRNGILFRRFVPVSTNGGYNFWKAFNERSNGTHNKEYDLSLFAPLREGDYDAVGYREGLRFIRAHPGRAIALAALKEGYLWGLERQFAIGLRDRTWGPIPWTVSLLILLAIPATQLFWVALAPLGLLRAPPCPLRREGLLLLGFTAALHLVFHGEARYHVPLLPLLLAAAAAAAVCLRAPGREWGEAAAGVELGGRERELELEPRRVLALALSGASLGGVALFWGYELCSCWSELGRLPGQ